MRTRSLAEGDAFSLEIGERLNRRIFRDNDRLGIAFLLDRGGVANPGPPRLREDRPGVPDIAEVDAADVDGLQQRRPELEIDPLDIDSFRLEDVFDGMPLAHRWKE